MGHFPETFIKLFLDLSRVYHPLVDLSLIERILDALFNFLSQNGFDIFRNKLSVDSVTVSHCEKVCPPVLTEVRQHQE